MIYFIQDESTCDIKIGFTDGDDAAERLDALQTGNPSGLVLLGTVSGDKDRERELHQRFASSRVRGEWFRPSPALLQFMFEGLIQVGSEVAEDLPEWLRNPQTMLDTLREDGCEPGIRDGRFFYRWADNYGGKANRIIRRNAPALLRLLRAESACRKEP